MVKIVDCYFDNKNYYFSDEDGGFTFFTGSDSNIVWKRSSDYQRSYLLLVDMLETLKRNSIQNIRLYHNTRIVEELEGVIKPMNAWGSNTLCYIRRNLLPYFIDYHIVKMSAEELKAIIQKGDEIAQHSCDVNPSELLDNVKRRRLRSFKDASKRD